MIKKIRRYRRNYNGAVHNYASSVYLLEDYAATKTKIKNISYETLEENDVVYFSFEVDFNRTKFRQWAKNKNIKITYNKEKADKIIIDNNKYFDLNYYELLGKLVNRPEVINEEGEFANLEVLIDSKFGTQEDTHFYINEYQYTKKIKNILEHIYNFNYNLNYVDVNTFDAFLTNNTLNPTFVNKCEKLLQGSFDDRQLALELLADSNFRDEKSFQYLIYLKHKYSLDNIKKTSRLTPLIDYLKTCKSHPFTYIKIKKSEKFFDIVFWEEKLLELLPLRLHSVKILDEKKEENINLNDLFK